MAKLRPDFATIGGLALAAVGIGGGLLLEGGSLGDITQGTAALIVLGGTFGAVLVNTPMAQIRGALRGIGKVLLEPQHRPEALIDEIIRYATNARKNGLVSLEDEAEEASDPFLRKALNLAVDGCDLQELRKMMELEMELLDARAHAEAKVFESAGGYAPTIGIIGAVLGLIQVMKHLADTESIGHGIATAFVATVYGVGIANLVFLPAANKIKARALDQMQMRELMLEGVASIVEGLNPKLVRAKLEAFLHAEGRSSDAAQRPKRAKAA
jgi:chemotaxis protein MotA